jgi:hypothetical protein
MKRAELPVPPQEHPLARTPQPLPQDELAAWAGSGNTARRTAAHLAGELRGKQRWACVPPVREIVLRLDVSDSTARRARKLLADHGLIMKDGRDYYVA